MYQPAIPAFTRTSACKLTQASTRCFRPSAHVRLQLTIVCELTLIQRDSWEITRYMSLKLCHFRCAAAVPSHFLRAPSSCCDVCFHHATSSYLPAAAISPEYHRLQVRTTSTLVSLQCTSAKLLVCNEPGSHDKKDGEYLAIGAREITGKVERHQGRASSLSSTHANSVAVSQYRGIAVSRKG